LQYYLLANFLRAVAARRAQYQAVLAPFGAQMTLRLLVPALPFAPHGYLQGQDWRNHSLITTRDRRKNCHLIIVVDWCVRIGDLSIYPDSTGVKYTLKISAKPSHCLRDDL
jgi:hypothetical protein